MAKKKGEARVIITLACITIAEAADFSHALHLKLKPECTSCHAKATTSTNQEEGPVLASDLHGLRSAVNVGLQHLGWARG